MHSRARFESPRIVEHAMRSEPIRVRHLLEGILEPEQAAALECALAPATDPALFVLRQCRARLQRLGLPEQEAIAQPIDAAIRTRERRMKSV